MQCSKLFWVIGQSTGFDYQFFVVLSAFPIALPPLLYFLTSCMDSPLAWSAVGHGSP